jgi:mannose-1-phosphate guanylyltransferase
VILAGGIGSRFWPASTPRRPKQLLPLASEEPLIRDTIERIQPLIPVERLRILAGAQLSVPIQAAAPMLGPGHFLLEPRAAGTAPVLAWAAAEIERIDPDAVMVSMHADHRIGPADKFRDRIRETARLAVQHERLFTIGAIPDRPETGFGYIHIGEPLADDGRTAGSGFLVDRFVEKPDVERASAYLIDGGYLWNTGIFVWRVRDLLDQLGRHTPEIAPLIPALRRGDVDAFFERVSTLSIDEGLLERSDRVAVVPADFDWDDIGSWEALFRSHSTDDRGNVMIGQALAVDTSDSALYADDGPVVAFGLEGMVVVRASGVTFVAPRERAAELKRLLDALPPELKNLE